MKLEKGIAAILGGLEFLEGQQKRLKTQKDLSSPDTISFHNNNSSVKVIQVQEASSPIKRLTHHYPVNEPMERQVYGSPPPFYNTQQDQNSHSQPYSFQPPNQENFPVQPQQFLQPPPVYPQRYTHHITHGNNQIPNRPTDYNQTPEPGFRTPQQNNLFRNSPGLEADFDTIRL